MEEETCPQYGLVTNFWLSAGTNLKNERPNHLHLLIDTHINLLSTSYISNMSCHFDFSRYNDPRKQSLDADKLLIDHLGHEHGSHTRASSFSSTQPMRKGIPGYGHTATEQSKFPFWNQPHPPLQTAVSPHWQRPTSGSSLPSFGHQKVYKHHQNSNKRHWEYLQVNVYHAEIRSFTIILLIYFRSQHSLLRKHPWIL